MDGLNSDGSLRDWAVLVVVLWSELYAVVTDF